VLRAALIAGAILVAGLIVSWPFVRPVYHRLGSEISARRAEAAARRGEAAQADIWWMNALRHRASDPALWIRYAHSLRASGSRSAMDAFLQAYVLRPTDLSAGLMAADEAFAAGRPEVAASVCTDILTRHTNDLGALQRLGTAYAALRRPHDATNTLHLVLRLDPAHAPARFALATIDLASSNAATADSARAVIVELSSRPEFAPMAAITLARACATTNVSAAIAQLDNWLRDHPDDWNASVERLDLRRRRGDASLAADLAELWPVANSANRRLDYLALSMRIGGPEAAELALDRLTARERNAPSTILIELETLASSGRWNEALRVCEKSIDLPRDDTGAIAILAWRFRTRRMLGESGAGGTLERMQEIAGRNAACALAAALMLEGWGFPGEAARLHHAASNLPGRTRESALPEALRCALRARDARFALVVAEDMLRDRPQDPLLQNNVASLLVATGGDAQRAYQLARTAYGARKEDPIVMETYASVLAADGRAADALKMYALLPAQLANEPTVRLRHARALNAVGRRAEALELARDIKPEILCPEEQAALQTLRGL
jgi:predicted Zn-dependent protease